MCSEIQSSGDSGNINRALDGIFEEPRAGSLGACFSEFTVFQSRGETGERDSTVQVVEICGLYIVILAKCPFEPLPDFCRSMQTF